MTRRRPFHRDIRRWSPSDDAILSASYPKGLPVCRIAFPNRSIPAILARAKRLGLSRALAGTKRHWTGADEAKLRRLWVSTQRSEIEAAIPDRSWPAIVSKAGKLGLSARSMTARRPLKTSSDPIIKEIGDRMRALGLTMADLDDASGVGRNVSGRWFADQSRASLYNVRRAVEALSGQLTVVWEDTR